MNHLNHHTDVCSRQVFSWEGAKNVGSSLRPLFLHAAPTIAFQGCVCRWSWWASPAAAWPGALGLGCGSNPMGSHFGVGAPPIFEPILWLDWDVHWGYDLDFDPQPLEHGAPDRNCSRLITCPSPPNGIPCSSLDHKGSQWQSATKLLGDGNVLTTSQTRNKPKKFLHLDRFWGTHVS